MRMRGSSESTFAALVVAIVVLAACTVAPGTPALQPRERATTQESAATASSGEVATSAPTDPPAEPSPDPEPSLTPEPGATTEPSPTQQPSPGAGSGQGMALLEDRCTKCHSLDRVVQSRKTRDDWEDVVERMIEKGATLSHDEKDALVEYLAATYRP